MKKLYSTDEYKKRNTKHAKDCLKQRLSKKRRNKTRQSTDHFKKLPAPRNFSFIENTAGVISYLKKIRSHIDKDVSVLIDLKSIDKLTNDAIVLLLATVQSLSIKQGVSIQGNSPRKKKLRRIFIESGIFGANTKNKHKNYILTQQNKKADGAIANEIIKQTTKFVFDHEARCQGVYRALMECMANTCYHAKPDQVGHETWWLTVYYNESAKKASFAFVDMGVGIFKTKKVISLKEKLTDRFGFTDNREVLKKIIEGRKMSSTQLRYRGKGLPSIYLGASKRNAYSNLKIVSNDVKADLSMGKYEKLSKEFSGTFIYWELNKTNKWIK